MSTAAEWVETCYGEVSLDVMTRARGQTVDL